MGHERELDEGGEEVAGGKERLVRDRFLLGVVLAPPRLIEIQIGRMLAEEVVVVALDAVLDSIDRGADVEREFVRTGGHVLVDERVGCRPAGCN